MKSGCEASERCTAANVSRVSWEPSITSTSMPVARNTRSTKVSRFSAARTALVATARVCVTP